MADGRHVGKCYNSPTMDYLGRNLGGHITPCPRHVRHDAVAMAAMLKNILNALTLLPMDRL